jgi:hypothetical protein
MIDLYIYIIYTILIYNISIVRWGYGPTYNSTRGHLPIPSKWMYSVSNAIGSTIPIFTQLVGL